MKRVSDPEQVRGRQDRAMEKKARENPGAFDEDNPHAYALFSAKDAMGRSGPRITETPAARPGRSSLWRDRGWRAQPLHPAGAEARAGCGSTEAVQERGGSRLR